MKNHFLTLILTVTLTFTSAALAGPIGKAPIVEPEPAGFWYAKGFGGVSFYDDLRADGHYNWMDQEYDTGWIAGGGIGYQFPDHLFGALRLDLEGFYSEAGLDRFRWDQGYGDLSQTGILFNLIKDIDIGRGACRPYFGAGLGAIHLDLDTTMPFWDWNYTGEDWTFGYQFMAGLEVPLSSRLLSFVEYRVVGADDPELGGYNYDTLWSQHAIVGFRLSF